MLNEEDVATPTTIPSVGGTNTAIVHDYEDIPMVGLVDGIPTLVRSPFQFPIEGGPLHW